MNGIDHFVNLMLAGGSNYPIGLLPNIDEEIARNFKVKELSSILLKKKFSGTGTKNKNKIDIRMPVFERWLLDSKFEEDQQQQKNSTSTSLKDPILPLHSSPASKASRRLITELLSNGVDNDEAEHVTSELCRTTNLACQELLSQRERYRKQSPLKKGDRIYIEQPKQPQPQQSHGSENHVVTILYSRKKWKKPFCFKINQKHYQNLKERFANIHDSTTNQHTANQSSTTSDTSLSFAWPPSSLCSTRSHHGDNTSLIERSFNVIVLALLLRYSALSGGQLLDDLRGGGMQGAIHSEVFEVLQSHFSTKTTVSSSECWLEGFASPFNATLPYFASAFPELDWHFGSIGSFFDCQFEASDDECCEANPPFSPGIMEGMADHMMKTLQCAREKNKRLTFIVVVPSADDKKPSKSFDDNENSGSAVKKAAFHSFQSMVFSTFCSTHIRLRAREHGYVEGSQHLRPTMFKQSSYDTSVIILQSIKSKGESSTGKNLEQLEKSIRSAFASRHEEETSLRKRKSMEN